MSRLVIRTVLPSGSAFAAGLRPGDVIVSHDKVALVSAADFSERVASSVGNELVVERDGVMLTRNCGPAPLGVGVAWLSRRTHHGRLAVACVSAEGVGARVGLRPGDLVLRLNGRPPVTSEGFEAEIDSKGCNVVEVMRTGAFLRLEGGGGPWGVLLCASAFASSSTVEVAGLTPAQHLRLAGHLRDFLLFIGVFLVCFLLAAGGLWLAVCAVVAAVWCGARQARTLRVLRGVEGALRRVVVINFLSLSVVAACSAWAVVFWLGHLVHDGAPPCRCEFGDFFGTWLMASYGASSLLALSMAVLMDRLARRQRDTVVWRRLRVFVTLSFVGLLAFLPGWPADFELALVLAGVAAGVTAVVPLVAAAKRSIGLLRLGAAVAERLGSSWSRSRCKGSTKKCAPRQSDLSTGTTDG